METLAAALAVAGVDRPVSVIGTRARIDLLTALNTALTSNPESPDALSSVGFILISKDQKPCFEVYPKRRNPEIGVFAACEQEHECRDGAPTKTKGVPQYAPQRLHNIVPIQSKLASAGYANGSDLGEINSDVIQQGPFISPTYGACQATTVVHNPHFNRNINIHTGPTQADTLELRFAQLEQELQHRQEQHIHNRNINSHTGPTQTDTLELRVAQLEQELQRRREQHIQYCLRQNQLDFASSNKNARNLHHLSGMASLAHYEKEGPQSPIEVQVQNNITKNAMSKIPNRVSEYDPLSKSEMPEKKRKTTKALSKGSVAKKKRTVKPSAYILFMTDFFRCLGNHDGKKRGGTMKAAALAWRTLPDEKRKEYERKTKIAIEKWHAGADTEMSEGNAAEAIDSTVAAGTNTGTNRSIIQNEDDKLSAIQEKYERTGKPSAYILFMTDFCNQNKASFGNHDGDIGDDGNKRGGSLKAAALAWRTLPNTKRKEYERKATIAIEKWLAGADTEMVGEEHDELLELSAIQEKYERTGKPSAYILFMTDFCNQNKASFGNHDGDIGDDVNKRGGSLRAAALAWRTLPNTKRKEYERKATFAIKKWLAGADTEMVGEEPDKLLAQPMSDPLVQDPLSASPMDSKEAFQNATTSTKSSSLERPVSKHAASQASVLDSGKDSLNVPAADTTTDTASEQQADSKQQKRVVPIPSTVRKDKYRKTLRSQPEGQERMKAFQNKYSRRSRLRKKTRKFVEDNLFKRQQFDRIELEEIESRVNIFISWQKRAIRKLKRKQEGSFNKTVDVVDEEIIFDLGHARYESDVIGEMVKVRELRIKGKEYKPDEQLDRMKEIRKKETEKVLKELHAAAGSTPNESSS